MSTFKGIYIYIYIYFLNCKRYGKRKPKLKNKLSSIFPYFPTKPNEEKQNFEA